VPGLEVEGVGPIALPLLPAQAEQLISVASARLSAAASRQWWMPTCGGPGRLMRLGFECMARDGRGVWQALSKVLLSVSAYLALLSIEESGSAKFTGEYRSYRRGLSEDADGFEVLEVIDRTETLSDWRRPDGSAPGLGVLPFDPDEISPPEALEDWAPDNQSFSEATGNEGASFERSYRKAALVLWPSRRRLAVVNHGGLPATLPYLADLSEQWAASGEDHRSPSKGRR